MSDHYETLGVEKSADAATIRKAYRKKSARHHPDRGGDPKVMALVNVAYETLSDPKKRKRYDTGGTEPVSSVEQEARASIMQLFAQAMDAPPMDLIKRGRDAFRACIDRNKGEITRLERRAERLKGRREEIVSEGEENLWTQFIDSQIAGIAEKIAQHTRGNEVAQAGLALLKAYRSKVVEPVSPYERQTAGATFEALARAFSTR